MRYDARAKAPRAPKDMSHATRREASRPVRLFPFCRTPVNPLRAPLSAHPTPWKARSDRSRGSAMEIESDARKNAAKAAARVSISTASGLTDVRVEIMSRTAAERGET